MAFYKALGGGAVVKKGLMSLGSKAVRANNKRSKAYLATINGESNLKGAPGRAHTVTTMPRAGRCRCRFPSTVPPPRHSCVPC